ILTAMRDALARGGRLHHDISIGNIVLVQEPDSETRRGYLIDWELSSRVNASHRLLLKRKPWQGTPWFMVKNLSARVHSGHRRAFQDDMESLLYVVLHAAFRWQSH
ncbi:uncharacterized protein BXZ73DRAFT_16232, partial [Epithele typhae]|uniref:uncharacterized protein n=1 Tax=Epithele typhae TaxID=378194 RepID=UPI0020075C29